MKGFCDCYKCGRDITVGEIIQTVSWQKEKIIDEYSVQPVQAESILCLCVDCSENIDLRKTIVGLMAKT